jgi:methylated-DNA-[protein]-cysteine S-methyltransferase
MKKIFFYQTDIGKIAIAEDEAAISHLFLPGDEIPPDAVVQETKLLKEANLQLQNYLSGDLRDFSLPLAPHGTDFMRRVWEGLCSIPYGETCSYKEIAESLKSPRAFRAVGLACNRNPIPIFIPCHRIIGANGKLTGYRAGLVIKERLLAKEHFYMVCHPLKSEALWSWKT